MQVKILSITQPLVRTEDDSRYLTAEEFIVYAARISNPSNQMNTETSDKLLAYLIKHKHVSPFEQAHFGVEVKTSRAIAAQILRHWTLAIQEYSQRYAEAVEIEPIEIRKQGANRQGGEESFDPKVGFDYCDIRGNPIPLYMDASKAIDMAVKNCVSLYKGLIVAGVAKETARFILPLATQTTMVLTGDLRTWIFYLQQRLDAHAQKEHRDVAKEINDIFKTNFPNIAKALSL